MVKERLKKKLEKVVNFLKENKNNYFFPEQLYIEIIFGKKDSITRKQFGYIQRLLKGEKNVKKIIIGGCTMFGYFDGM